MNMVKSTKKTAAKVSNVSSATEAPNTTEENNMGNVPTKQPTLEEILADLADEHARKGKGGKYVEWTDAEETLIQDLAAKCLDGTHSKRGLQSKFKVLKDAGMEFPGIGQDKTHSAFQKKLDACYAELKKSKA